MFVLNAALKRYTMKPSQVWHAIILSGGYTSGIDIKGLYVDAKYGECYEFIRCLSKFC